MISFFSCAGLVEACADHHPKVKESAKKSLSDISSVIRNPEVSQLAPTLIAALTEPASKTKPALEALLECEFMHSIDAPSLAILIPILTRALKDRGGDLKRKSAIISGNMCSMISDPKIIVPYLGQVTYAIVTRMLSYPVIVKYIYDAIVFYDAVSLFNYVV